MIGIEHKDCIIVYKSGKGIALRATGLTVVNSDKMVVVCNGDEIMAIVPLAEIKTIIFADCGDYETVNSMIEAITAK